MTRLSDFVGGRSMSELYDTYWVPSVLAGFARELAERVTPGERVLDLACGTGLVAAQVAARAGPSTRVVGLDPSADFLQTARAKPLPGAPIEWIEGSAEYLPFERASFDVVLCHQGLQYVADREQTFREVKRVLRPGGRLHAGVWAKAADQPAFGFFEESLARHFGSAQKPVHAWSFGGLPELRRLAEGAGLIVERLETVRRQVRLESIQQAVDVQIACAGRTDENGRLAMGLVDLSDRRWLPAIEAFSAEAHAALSGYLEEGVLKAPSASDELSARA